jgi:putative membrane protein
MFISSARARALAAALAAGACLATLPFTAGAVPSGKPARATPLTDANIVAIVIAANDGDIHNGELALANADAAAVKDFGKMMVTDHSSSNLKTKALAARLGLRPVQNATSRGLVKSANATHDELAALNGEAFDKSYMDAEVTVHGTVLELLDQRLIPSAKSAELKALLTGVRAAVARHLDRAKAVRAGL